MSCLQVVAGRPRVKLHAERVAGAGGVDTWVRRR